jgi:hypothetical protein
VSDFELYVLRRASWHEVLIISRLALYEVVVALAVILNSLFSRLPGSGGHCAGRYNADQS